MQILNVISVSLSIFATLLALWTANNSGIRRLVKIQQRLDASMGLILTVVSRVNNIEKFNSVKHGYHIRDDASEVEDFFKNIYRDSDTGI